MAPDLRDPSVSETTVTVRYWASIRAAAGCAQEQLTTLSGTTLAEVTALLEQRHGADFARVAAVCSVLIDDEPLGGRDPQTVVVPDGVSLEFLPPFAGG